MFIIRLIVCWIVLYIIVAGGVDVAVSNPFSKPSLSNRGVRILSAIITTALIIFAFWALGWDFLKPTVM